MISAHAEGEMRADQSVAASSPIGSRCHGPIPGQTTPGDTPAICPKPADAPGSSAEGT